MKKIQLQYSGVSIQFSVLFTQYYVLTVVFKGSGLNSIFVKLTLKLGLRLACCIFNLEGSLSSR